MKNIGYLLLLASFLAAAFLASLDAREMDWTLMIPVLLVGFVGVIMVRRVEHAAASADHVLKAHREDLETSLNNIIATLKTLNAKEDDIPTYEMRFEIDKLLRSDDKTLGIYAMSRDSSPANGKVDWREYKHDAPATPRPGCGPARSG